MTLKDIYRAIFRIFAVFLLFTTVTGLIVMIPNVIYYPKNIWAPISIVVSFAVLLMFFIYLIWKTDSIISFLKLDRNMTIDEIKITNLTDTNIIKAALLIISVYFFMRYLPSFVYNSLAYFVEDNNSISGISGEFNNWFGDYIFFNFYDWITALTYLIFSYLLFINYQAVSKFLTKRVIEKTDTIDDL